MLVRVAVDDLQTQSLDFDRVTEIRYSGAVTVVHDSSSRAQKCPYLVSETHAPCQELVNRVVRRCHDQDGTLQQPRLLFFQRYEVLSYLEQRGGSQNEATRLLKVKGQTFGSSGGETKTSQRL